MRCRSFRCRTYNSHSASGVVPAVCVEPNVWGGDGRGHMGHDGKMLLHLMDLPQVASVVGLA